MKLTAGQLKDMQRNNAKWPATLTEIPREQWESIDLNAASSSGHFEDVLWRTLRSRTFLVQLYRRDSLGEMIRLSAQRTEYDNKTRRFKDGISWDELMKLKLEAGYGDQCALEVYPPEDLIVNVANIRHLFILPKGSIPHFVWRHNG